MFRLLFLIFAIPVFFTFVRAQEKPKAYKFFEFERASNNLLKEKLEEFRAKLTKESSAGYIINYGTDKESAKR